VDEALITLPEWLNDRGNEAGPELRKAHMAKMRKMTTVLHQKLLKQTVEKHRLHAEIEALATEASRPTGVHIAKRSRKTDPTPCRRNLFRSDEEKRRR